MRCMWALCLVVPLLGGCLERELKSLNPCLVSGVVRSIETKSITQIDLLFVVDNSNSMAEEQDALKAQFPRLIQALTTGVRSDGGKPFPPVKDLHLGVVSTDMGLAGIPGTEGCDANGGGDDGLLQNTGRAAGCQASYPKFLSFEQDHSDPNQVARDFACVATLGTGGCGFEQQLEAGLKALWPKTFTDKDGNVLADNPITFLSTTEAGRFGHGDIPITQGGNGGFLRNAPGGGGSLIAIIVVSDEEDCSAIDTQFFSRSAPAYAGQPLNQRCLLNKGKLFEVDRYVRGFKALRPGNEDLVIFAAIVGVPTDLVMPEQRKLVNLADPELANAYYQAILDDPRMQEQPNGLTGNLANLKPSCYGKRADGEPAPAYPPRRIVEVARGFGANGVVQSICAENFEPAIDAIIAAIADAIPSVCLPRPLVRKSDGLVSCNVIWELPPAAEAPIGTPTGCEGPDGLLQPVDADREATNDRNGNNCKVRQLAVASADAAPEGRGWFYDDFSTEAAQRCRGGTHRVAFTDSAQPGAGVVVKLECLNETQRLPSTDPRRAAGQPEIGSACVGRRTADGVEIPRESACSVRLQDDSLDTSLFCHSEQNVCVQACSGDSACPPAWVCDTRPASTAQTAGRGFCVNPTCGSD